MTKKTLILIILILTIFIVGLAYIYNNHLVIDGPIHPENFTRNQLDNNAEIYEVLVPYNLDTVPFNATVDLNVKKNKHILSLPNAGTETNIIIGDSLYLQNLDKNPKILLSADFYSNEEVLIDISKLAKGKYTVHYLGCNMGGIFPLTLK